MEFDVKPRGAGSVGAILANEQVANVYGAFGDGCMRCYRMDIREKRTYMSSKVLRQVQTFVSDYGEDDALGIVEEFFGVMHEGNFNGKPLGTSLFSKGFRWFADQLLAEHERQSIGLERADGEPAIGEHGAVVVKSLVE